MDKLFLRSVSADQIYKSKKYSQKLDFPSSPKNQFEIRKEFDKERKRLDKGKQRERSSNEYIKNNLFSIHT